MTEADVIRDVRRSWEFLKAAGLHELFSDPSPLNVTEEFRRISSDASATYEEVYLEGLRRGQYNIVLTDYSYLQFGGRNDETLRYAYYPNPFLGSSRKAISELDELREYVDEGILDMDEYLHRVSELRYTQHPPLVRYENAPSQYVEMVHPCSHLHIGHHAENRWPVRRVLTPAAFTLTLMKLFYSEHWQAAKPVRAGQRDLCLDDLMILAKSDCRVLPDELFSQKASLQFFFG